MRVVCYHMYQVFKPTILNSHSLWLMESQSKSTAKPQSLRQAPVHCDSISKLPVITSRCKSTCDQQNAGDGNPKARPSSDSHGLAYFHLRRYISCRRKEITGIYQTFLLLRVRRYMLFSHGSLSFFPTVRYFYTAMNLSANFILSISTSRSIIGGVTFA